MLDQKTFIQCTLGDFTHHFNATMVFSAMVDEQLVHAYTLLVEDWQPKCMFERIWFTESMMAPLLKLQTLETI